MQDMKEEFNKDGNIGEKQSEIAKNEKHSEANARLCGKSQHRMAGKRTEFLGLETRWGTGQRNKEKDKNRKVPVGILRC